MHLIALVLNDLPAQIPKACETLLPSLFKSLEQRIPNYNGFFLSLLKLINAVSVHEAGKECLKKSLLIEKTIKVPVEPNYGYHFINCEKVYEYNGYLRDILRNDEDLRNRATKQLHDNVDYLLEETVKYTQLYLFTETKERIDIENGQKDLVAMRRNLTDQIDGFFNLISHIIIEVNGGFQNRVVEQSVCTPEMFKKVLELFNIPHVADILAKDNIIYREVYKIFINEYPQLLKTVHEDLTAKLTEIEAILGPLKD